MWGSFCPSHSRFCLWSVNEQLQTESLSFRATTGSHRQGMLGMPTTWRDTPLHFLRAWCLWDVCASVWPLFGSLLLSLLHTELRPSRRPCLVSDLPSWGTQSAKEEDDASQAGGWPGWQHIPRNFATSNSMKLTSYHQHLGQCFLFSDTLSRPMKPDKK